MAAFDTLNTLKSELIRKAQTGTAFIKPADGTHLITSVEDPFTYTAAAVGPPATPEKIEWAAFAVNTEALGYLTDDGLGFENETSQSDTTSWQSISPTRSDLLTDTDTLAVVAQETKLLSIGLYTGVETSTITVPANTGMLTIKKPTRPTDKRWEVLAVAVDGTGADEIFIARYMPNAKVTGKVGQRFGKGDDPIAWGVTFTAFEASDLGFATTYYFGGRGWKAKLAAMGITAA